MITLSLLEEQTKKPGRPFKKAVWLFHVKHFAAPFAAAFFFWGLPDDAPALIIRV